MKKALFLVVGAVVLIVGVIVLILPIPFGLPIIAAGTGFLVMGSDTIAEWIKRRRKNNDVFDEKLRNLQQKAPEEVCEPLEKTNPKTNQNTSTA